jgi:hypothetical protein
MSPATLFELLPTVYRLRDLEQGGSLEALVSVIADQAGRLQEDLEGMWDDLFIETCHEWVVPYIGDLVSNTPLYEVPGVGRRADVADTIHWRRRKGTLAMLGDLARHVTGWGGHAVATFELLSWNQNLNHIRMLAGADDPAGLHGPHPLVMDRVGSVDLRDRDCVDRIDTPWDQACHTVDVRRIRDDEGWYGIRKVCFFCFRLESFPMAGMTPALSPSGGAGCYHLSPLGQDAPVFHYRTPIRDTQEYAREENVDAPIRPYRFYLSPALDWGQTLALTIGGTPVPVGDVICKDLATWSDPVTKVGVDVRRGRIRVGSKYTLKGALTCDASYGFSAALGGGPYPRDAADAITASTALTLQVPTVAYPTLEAAVSHWQSQPAGDVQIVINDSATYAPAGGVLDLTRTGLAAPVGITIIADPHERPLIVGDIKVGKTKLHELVLDGLLISGSVSVAGPVQEVSLTDCTLVPGIALGEDGTPQKPDSASLSCDRPADQREITFERCITGPLRIPADGNHLSALDSVIDAPAGPPHRVALAADDAGKQAGPPSDLERVTVFGTVHVRELTLASECIFTEGFVRAERRQAGCMRFSSLELAGSLTPRRYRCQPDLVRAAAGDPATAELETARVRPTFTSVHYGQPAYCQLGRGCAIEIRQGAEGGAEMGVFQSLLQPFRETNLRVRLDEYLPFGLEPGIVHVT